MEIVFVLLAFAFEFIGPFIVAALLIRGAFLAYNGIKLCRSLMASRGDEQAAQLEMLRVKGSLLRNFCFIPGAAVLYFGLSWNLDSRIIFLAAFLGCFSMYLWGGSLQKRYNENFKKTLVAIELGKVFDKLKYEADGVFEPDVLRDLNFFTEYAHMSGNDVIRAEYAGNPFSLGDIRLAVEVTVSSKGRRQTRLETVFTGRVMRFDFATPFRGPVQVVGRNFERARVKYASEDWETVETELDAFNEKYEVFARDPLDAMTVLQPQMIEAIFALDAAAGKPQAFYFTGNTMFVFQALNRDAFDTSHKTLQEEKALLQKDIAFITNFLDTLHDRKHRAEVLEAAAAAATLVGISLTPSSESMTRIGNSLRTFAKIAGKVAYFAPLAVYLVSICYIAMNFPDEFYLRYSSSGEISPEGFVPTSGYLLIGALFILPSVLAGGRCVQAALAGIVVGMGSGLGFVSCLAGAIGSCLRGVMILLPFWLHLFFLFINRSMVL